MVVKQIMTYVQCWKTPQSVLTMTAQAISVIQSREVVRLEPGTGTGILLSSDLRLI